MTAGGGANAAIVGIGYSRLFRHDQLPLGTLAIEAIIEAVGDAGLSPSDIDGISTTPSQPFEGSTNVDGINVVSPEFVQQVLHLDVGWSERQLRPIGASLINTIHAVASGHCNYAVCFKALSSPAGRYGSSDSQIASGASQFLSPYGVFPPAIFALHARAHMDRYGSTREELGRFVVGSRNRALRWEFGYWHQLGSHPISLDDYFDARMISDPLCLLDCDLPVQTAAAFVVTTRDRARDLRHSPAYVHGTAGPFSAPRRVVSSLEDYMRDGRQVARHLWTTARYGADDVNIANLYDGFSVITPLWAEALGLCPEGQGFSFAASPTLPLNPSGGSLGSGRIHGIGQLVDSVLQIQRRSGPRQVEPADLCLVATNPCSVGTAFLLGAYPE